MSEFTPPTREQFWQIAAKAEAQRALNDHARRVALRAAAIAASTDPRDLAETRSIMAEMKELR